MGAEGQHFVIRADKLTDENSLDNPHRIVPQAQSLPNCAKQISVSLPAYSVNVLRIPAQSLP